MVQKGTVLLVCTCLEIDIPETILSEQANCSFNSA